VVCRGEVLSGEPAEAILTFADQHNADMIILSTHGAQGFEKILIGSIADRVIKGAGCPCLVFNPFKKTWRYTSETGTKK
jgi:nucleotide-binding universal stress UspA family protein